MNITFNNITTEVRKNDAGLFSLTDIEKAWRTTGEKLGRLQDWKLTEDYCSLLKLKEIQVVSTEGRNGGTWGCERAAVLYASYSSTAFQLAVIDTFITASKGDGQKAVVIAQETMDLREALKDTTKALNRAVCDAANDGVLKGTVSQAMRHAQGLACKAVTGLDAVAFKGRYGMSARDFLLQQNDATRLGLMARIEGKIEAWVEAGIGHEALKERLAPDFQRAKDSWPYPIPQPIKKAQKEAA